MPLPSPEAHGLPDDTVIAVPVPDDGLTVFRLLRGAEPRVEDFEPDYTRPQAQLRRIPELFRSSISSWLQRDQALAQSTQMQVWIARVVLEPNPLTRVALTELGLGGKPQPGHIDVWGYPRELLACVAEVSETKR